MDDSIFFPETNFFQESKCSLCNYVYIDAREKFDKR